MITDKQKEYLIKRYNFKTATERNIKYSILYLNNNIRELKDLLLANQYGFLKDVKHNSLMYRVYSGIFETGNKKLWDKILYMKLYDLGKADYDYNIFDLIKDKKHNQVVLRECLRFYYETSPETITKMREYINDNIRKENELLGE